MAALRWRPPFVPSAARISRANSLSGRGLTGSLRRHGDHDKDIETRAGPRRRRRRATDDLHRRHAARRDADAPAAVRTARHRREEVLRVPDLVPGAHLEYAGQVHRHRRLAAPVVDDDVAASYLIAARPDKHLWLRRGGGLRLVGRAHASRLLPATERVARPAVQPRARGRIAVVAVVA